MKMKIKSKSKSKSKSVLTPYSSILTPHSYLLYIKSCCNGRGNGHLGADYVQAKAAEFAV